MKKLLYLLMFLPITLLASCSKDEVPSADITMTLGNVALVDGKIYAVEGTPVTVESITVNSTNGKATGLSTVEYSIDHRTVSVVPDSPFSYEVDPTWFPVGNHLFQSQFLVLQVDRSIFTAEVALVIHVVPTVDDIPGGAPLGLLNERYTISPE